jgi:chromosome segregation ATPase
MDNRKGTSGRVSGRPPIPLPELSESVAVPEETITDAQDVSRPNTKDAMASETTRQGNMRQERDNIEERFAQAEERVRRLTGELNELKDLWEETQREREQEQSSTLKEDYETLKKAVLDYVIAYGAVDVQVALLRARGDSAGEVLDNLRRSLEEQANALHHLRSLARTLQHPDRPQRD